MLVNFGGSGFECDVCVSCVSAGELWWEWW